MLLSKDSAWQKEKRKQEQIRVSVDNQPTFYTDVLAMLHGYTIPKKEILQRWNQTAAHISYQFKYLFPEFKSEVFKGKWKSQLRI